ncbi:MAG: hypothetical protein L4877_00965 [Aigarchaeota archaeon]|nr:hypothetical protein [Candidatus Geocrenenecus dongiae]
MSEEVIRFKCEVCGSSLNVSPEDIVSICKYCGGLNSVSRVISRDDIYVVPSVDEGKIIEEFWRRVRGDIDLRKIAEKIRIKSIQGWYIPYWISRVEVEGVVIYTKKEHNGKHVKIIKKKEKFSRALDMHVVGRRQMKNVGVGELINAYFKHKAETVGIRDLDEGWWRSNKLNFLNIEFDRDEAAIMIREDAVDFIRKKWEDMADEIKFFKAEILNMEKPKLVLLPLWEVIYEYRGSLYFAYHEGWSGSSLIFAEPMTVGRRFLYLAGMISSVVGGMLIGIIFSTASYNGSDYTSILILLFFFITFLGYRFAKKFISDVRVERSWG